MGRHMLHAVLNMSRDIWGSGEIDEIQRESRYIEASKEIQRLDDEVEKLREEITIMKQKENTTSEEIPTLTIDIIIKGGKEILKEQGDIVIDLTSGDS